MKEPTPSNAVLARRVQEIRAEVFGEGLSGLEAIAADLSLPPRTWDNYESGVTMPATTLVHFIALTGANPGWLMAGSGERYSRRRGSIPGRLRFS
jgi:hypothetical protein